MGEKFPVVKDAAERVIMTFVLTVLALATADGVDWTDWGSLSNWQTWAVAGITAAFTLVKAIVAAQIGKVNGHATSASLAPSVKLQPER